MHDTSVAFLRAWLKSAVWAEPPKELGMEGWLWYVEKVPSGMREPLNAFQSRGQEHVLANGAGAC